MDRRSAQPVALPVVQPATARGTRMGRRRAIVLLLVHALIAVHLAHYMAAGRTLSPVEPSEAGHTLRDGAINAGAIFLVLTVLSTLVLGRFFCGWACHLVAYQDLARWIALRLGVRLRPVRSRLMLFVPLFAAYWLFGKPLVDRWAAGNPAPAISWHLTTEDFWATFPGPAITVLTFLVCGGLIVLVLGAKGFCSYGCPYGALFVVADRFAPGRIRVNDDCDGSAECTRHCSSNVDVAGEVARYGMVVDPGCMKCMDCIAICPNDALSFGFGPGASAARRRRPRPLAWLWSGTTLLAVVLGGLTALAFAGRWSAGVGGAVALALAAAAWPARRDAGAARPDPEGVAWCSLREELLLVGAFTASFAILFQLYRIVPLLLAIGLAVIVAGLALATVRVLRRPDVALQGLALRSAGRLRPAGLVLLAAALGGAALLGHAAFIQWHTREAVAAFQTAQQLRWGGDERWRAAAAAASGHLA
ncbi:MAG: 4Fe-4S binding protein, partial [Planctomycetota bacterium]